MTHPCYLDACPDSLCLSKCPRRLLTPTRVALALHCASLSAMACHSSRLASRALQDSLWHSLPGRQYLTGLQNLTHPSCNGSHPAAHAVSVGLRAHRLSLIIRPFLLPFTQLQWTMYDSALVLGCLYCHQNLPLGNSDRLSFSKRSGMELFRLA